MSQTKNLSTVEKLMDGYNPYRQRQEEADERDGASLVSYGAILGR